MKRKFLSSVAIVALVTHLGSSTPARAVDPEYWSGFYLGGHLGYGYADYDGIFDSTDPAPTGTPLESLNPDGFAGGIHGGFNFILDAGAGGMDAFLLGIEGDVTFADLHDSTTGAFGEDTINGDINLLASVRARAGIIFDDVLIYATGGIAFADAELEGVDNGLGGGAGGSTSFSDVGGVIGGGIEFAGFEFATIRIEGLYYIFDDRKDTSTLSTTSEPGDFARFDDAFVVRAGISVPLNGLFGP